MWIYNNFENIIAIQIIMFKEINKNYFISIHNLLLYKIFILLMLLYIICDYILAGNVLDIANVDNINLTFVQPYLSQINEIIIKDTVKSIV